MEKKRVVVALSGGVDSSVTAALLKREGYDVIGVTMQTWPDLSDEVEEIRQGGCCSVAAVDDARRVADKLDIPYYVLNFKENFQEKVIDYFLREYTHGRTPNPCIACNRYVKFDELLRRAQALDADYIATGHYAKVEQDSDSGRFVLRKSVDSGKDQTYALYNLTQPQLAHTLMPLGYYEKTVTRRIARELGLATANKPDSQEICFVLDDDYKRFIAEKAPEAVKPGPILDTRGRVLGTHTGLPNYTVGQRRGLGLTASQPLYVVDLLPEQNAVVVGTGEETLSDRLEADDLNWIAFERPDR
ncbi:MAG: tRNA 2-thiouridine(34) synthase MnmA, partial [Bacillota bacterium]